jgi:hypothetical protein
LPASGQVLDASPLIASLSDLASAEIAANASRAEAVRSQGLYDAERNIARKALDAALAQQSTDQARVMTLKGQILAAWGRDIASLSSTARRQLADDLLAGHASLVRADQFRSFAPGAGVSGARVSTLDSSAEWPAQWLGALPQTTSATLGGASLLRVPAALPAGQVLTVNLQSSASSTRGPSAPVSAVIRWRGGEWIYEETSTNHFERREVMPGGRAEGRVLLGDEKSVKGKVVVVGARALLAAELGAADAHDNAKE